MLLDITFHEMDSSLAVQAAIERWALRLEQVYDRILRIHVTIEKPHRHRRHQPDEFRVGLHLEVPGPNVTVSRSAHSHEDIYVAIADAFRAARRQLIDHARVQRDFVKPPIDERHQVIHANKPLRT